MKFEGITGPWDNEPDAKDWEHSGYNCAIRRNDSGSWCGYVEVPKTSILFGKNEEEVYEFNFEIHGGLTYVGSWSEDGWWLGFDCAHYKDLIPIMRKYSDVVFEGFIYRDIDYAISETNSLAEQIAKIDLKVEETEKVSSHFFDITRKVTRALDMS